ncbi:unnamed protein product [Mycena citricolor]|uniref:Uncharacterized protein n=1 Tax=Mycena citricolor TaxID=2018698 RepID=A0AAD2H4W2_9AGAR|nr:unnamed protein product [Mycena citricolor]
MTLSDSHSEGNVVSHDSRFHISRSSNLSRPTGMLKNESPISRRKRRRTAPMASKIRASNHLSNIPTVHSLEVDID